MLFEKPSPEQVSNEIKLNCYSVLLMTKNVLSIFKKRYQDGKAKHSLIINTSAMAAIAPFPYLGNYGAAKLFGDFLVEPLNYELKEFGVDVTSVRPAGVVTKLTADKLSKNDKTAVTAEQCAEGTCSKVTSGLQYGALKQCVMGATLENMFDVIPYELRILITEKIIKNAFPDIKELAGKEKHE